MGGCAAEHCNNSSSKGYLMKAFPRDPDRRAQWAKNAGFKTWKPTNFSRLCEVHFAPEMWEHRLDNKRRLKPNAVPTIFGYFIKKNTQIEINQSHSAHSSNSLVETVTEPIVAHEDVEYIEAEIDEEEMLNSTIGSTKVTHVADGCNQSEIDKWKAKYEILAKNANTLSQKLTVARRTIKSLRNGMRRLEVSANSSRATRALTRVFNKDQIRTLISRKPVRNWSDLTIQRALRLKLCCGVNGYAELLQHGIPLPSLRTLRRKLQNFNFAPGISDDMFQFFEHKKDDLERGLVLDEMEYQIKKGV